MTNEELDLWRSDPTTIAIFKIMRKNADEKEHSLKEQWFHNPTADLSADVAYLINYNAILHNLSSPDAALYNDMAGVS